MRPVVVFSLRNKSKATASSKEFSMLNSYETGYIFFLIAPKNKKKWIFSQRIQMKNFFSILRLRFLYFLFINSFCALLSQS